MGDQRQRAGAVTVFAIIPYGHANIAQRHMGNSERLLYAANGHMEGNHHRFLSF